MDINYHWRTKLRRELPLRFFVVFVAVQDLLLRAEHLFVAATFGYLRRDLRCRGADW
jgi:hypothetical protein